MTDTPETDDLARGNHVVPTEFAEKLERERNEAVRRYAELVLCSELLFQKRVAEKNAEASKICAQIYIARNITLDWQEIPSLLKSIDKLYRDENHN
jgi:hypothetical protein